VLLETTGYAITGEMYIKVKARTIRTIDGKWQDIPAECPILCLSL
jgi:hypothetical protein